MVKSRNVRHCRGQEAKNDEIRRWNGASRWEQVENCNLECWKWRMYYHFKFLILLIEVVVFQWAMEVLFIYNTSILASHSYIWLLNFVLWAFVCDFEVIARVMVCSCAPILFLHYQGSNQLGCFASNTLAAFMVSSVSSIVKVFSAGFFGRFFLSVLSVLLRVFLNPYKMYTRFQRMIRQYDDIFVFLSFSCFYSSVQAQFCCCIQSRILLYYPLSFDDAFSTRFIIHPLSTSSTFNVIAKIL